jgi:hypothetical protein
MVGHMNIEEQADVDFARRRAFLRRIGGRPSNGSYRAGCSASKTPEGGSARWAGSAAG